MSNDWLLAETLGAEPVVAAQGRQLKNLVPITAFLRRNPHLAAIQMAIAETVATGQSLASITPKNRRVIRTEPVRMSDGRIHGVHVWSGPINTEPPERPIPGAVKWDVTLGVATDTPEALANRGQDPASESTEGRAFAEDLPGRAFNANESKVLALAIRAEPGQTLCNSWDITDREGNPIRLCFVARTGLEPGSDGSDHLMSRGFNWRGEAGGAPHRPDLLAQRILTGLAQPGVHRALFGLDDWRILKWLDDPSPLYDWRDTVDGPRVHPDDKPVEARMAVDLAAGPAVGVLRLRRTGGGWIPLHLTVNRVEIENDTFIGLVAIREPTSAELTDGGLSAADVSAT